MDRVRSDSQAPHRRAFLTASTTAAWALLHGWDAFGAEPVKAGKLIPGKADRLIVHDDKIAVIETPLDLLDKSVVTPKQALFVRNNQQLPEAVTLRPLPLSGWTIQLTGLVDRPRTIRAEELLLLDQVEQEMVLQCSGNGRSQYARAAKTHGTQWGFGGVGNVRFAGVPLAAVLRQYGVRLDPTARFIAAEGKDEPPPGKPDFEHSLPLDESLRHSFLALRMNGEPIPAVHGGPVRLITPGYYGTMQMKWLSRLRFEAGESSNPHHARRYRMPNYPIKPGEAYAFDLQNSKPSWRMKLASIILTPEANAKVSAGKVTVRGVAYNDGLARIDAVLVSVDQGRTWQTATLTPSSGPYAWYRWATEVAVTRTNRHILARAVDALGRTQPLDGIIYWNPDGYEWNGTASVELTVV